MAELTQLEKIRLLLGEPIPEEGDETDTMFTDYEIVYFLSKAVGDFPEEQAAYHWWVAKQAQFANLVTVNEGNASREATELSKNASRMVTRFQPYVGSGNPVNSKGRARIGRIRRSGGVGGPYGAKPRRR